jgi:ankyrin repeat protein
VLQAAAEGGHAVIVASLLKARADVNAEPAEDGGRTALQAAAEEGHAEIVASLLTAGADVNAEPAEDGGRTALQAAAEEGHTEIVASLLTAGAYVNAKPAPDGARTALQAAAEGGHAGIVTSLLAAGADVNAAPARSSGTTALQAATEGGHVKIVANLLSLGTVIHAQPVVPLTKIAVWVGPSKRHVEALDASPDTDSQVQQLSVLKDNLSAVDPDKCLIWSIAQPKVLQLLLHAGMDTSVLSTNGSSPLHCSVKQKNIRSAGLLLLSGVKTNIRDHDNLTPLDLLLGSQTFFRPQCLRIFLWLGCEIRGRPIQLWREAYNQPAPKHFLTLTALQIPHSSRIHVLSKGQTHPATNGERLQSGKLGKTSIQITSSDDLPDVEWGDRRSLHQCVLIHSRAMQS